MSSPFPTLTPVPRLGTVRCAYVPSPNAPACGAPAGWHVAWHFTPGAADFSLVCEPHMADVQQDFVYVDRHPAAAACDLPGTGWLVGVPSRCVMAPTVSAETYKERAR
ncbi:hypothetical protein ACFVZH_22560 [Streptomyces sp. NPDC059534]|uniref:hypothetical protein n=1 Tax=Streptomyces sp. NPDC059534 TaxID=3346859 RepID=UPI00368FA850